ncbi:CYTH and CHAD domain-containing protein [Acinetobacter indicus]|uniref:CYTH and CHAD domain-containing protein n=1 Tax=Acinetobacter indicus TaxID=756892 RepID=UPI002096FA36|nr:CYTH and CHAD domain-containing protein [Acinetobacter indicus]MCO8108847.1 CYTH and CHAD domain-containing protein [Acinetobacter indicus]
MAEIELKFQVPVHQRRAFEKAIAKKKAVPMQLWAKYYDSPEQQLAQHAIALRQRLEGQRWCQTLKAPGQHHFERFELELALGPDEPEQLDLSLYQEHKQAQTLLKQALELKKADLKNTGLELQFETDVQRLIVLEQVKDSAIELAFDQGEVRTPTAQSDIYEVEFELKHGDVSNLIDFVQPWVKRYQLWLDVRSKSQRGQMLKNQQDILPVQHQTPFSLDKHDSSSHALAKIVSNCLTHLLPNATAIADNHYQSGHVHQARVAIRRLRSALKIFGHWSEQVQPEWQAQLAELFRQLGSTRDRDALSESLMPRLAEAGSPLAELPASSESSDEIDALFRAPETVRLLLELLQFSQCTAQEDDQSLKKQVRKQLAKMHRQICQDAVQFEHLDSEQKHRTRKRVKRLRYSVEFIASLFEADAVKQYLKALKPAQESLGQFNDLVVAEALFQHEVQQNPQAWFVLGWIAAEQKHVLAEAQQHLLEFTRSKTFWSN